jgi:hypothetical protein
VIEDGPEEFLAGEISDIASDVVQKPVVAEPLPQPDVAEENSLSELPSIADIPEVQEEKAMEDPLELFEARQRQYLLGKKASKVIIGNGGKVIVGEGEIITNDIIERAVSEDKYIELTMNVK